MKKLLLICMSVIMALGVVGCSSGSSIDSTSVIIDEKALVEQILENDETPMLQEPDETLLEDMFYLTPDLYESQYTMFSMFRTSATNVSVVKPKEGQYEAVKEALTKRKDLVFETYEQYRMEPAITVATNGQVIEKDGYIILLMVEAVDEALEKIEKAFAE
ncbi:MAG: DUF4358 domain-containing protein [Niameybacter sp.]|uniref:DUF4358 domain-containing protein n=1 Tax=Niameybacter sp. TaxID=2033640 RepID=UPI002FCC1F59